MKRFAGVFTGAVMAIANNAQAQELVLAPHFGLLYNGQISRNEFYKDYPGGAPAALPGQNADNFAASFFFATKEGTYREAVTCEHLAQHTLEQNVAPYLTLLRAQDALQEPAEHISRNAMRVAMAHCAR